MAQNILVTGAAGYVGGTVVQSLLTRTESLVKFANISTAVRSQEQAQALSKLGINVIQIDLSDELAVTNAVMDNKIDIVFHLASAMVARLASNLIKALGQRRKDVGRNVFFIHSSVTNLFDEANGWPYGEIRDTDPIYEKEKTLGFNPVTEADIAVVEESRDQGVTSFNIAVPVVYGKGTGEWNKLSSSIPSFVRTSIKHGAVYKFEKEGNPATAHVSDLADLYATMVEKILANEPIPSGEKGYYFAMAHRVSWYEVMEGLANCLHARGLITESEAQIWPSYEMAAEYLGWPPQYVRAMGTASGQIVPVNAYKIGWQPKWDEKRFLENLDEEIQAVQQLDTVRSSIYDALIK